MERNEILSKVDHTLLAQTATWAEIRAICDDGMKYHTASVCIPASYVKQAKDYVGGKLAISTVIGFPNGYDTTKAKCFEAADAVEKSEMILRQLRIDANSPFLGKTLKDAGIREKYHCLIVGVERGGETLHAPDVHEPFVEEDVVWIVGENVDVYKLVGENDENVDL